MAVISVDFPAPLSPVRATISPGDTFSETLLRASTAPNRFDALNTENIGPGSLSLAHSEIAALRLLDEHGDDDDGTDRNELPERLHVDENETVLNNGDNGGPAMVPAMFPQPPNRLAPPMTTAVMESSSSGSPACDAPAEKRPV